MALKVRIKGTLKELDRLYEWSKLYRLIRVDYYKRELIPDSEIFTITEEDLERAGLLFDQVRKP